ncbi:glycoside hydrolase family 6 protein [Nocardioides salsibiostraticola]
MPHLSRPTRAASAVLLTLGLVCSAALLVTVPSTAAGPASPSGPASAASVESPPVSARPNADNPLAARPWAVYSGPYELWYEPWRTSTGRTRALLDKIALRPKSAWFGSWIADNKIAEVLDRYIVTSQGGNPEALVQFAVFRMDPWESAACKRTPTLAEQRSYKTWIQNAAAAVGDTPAAIVIQPDSPFAVYCAPNPKLSLRLIRYATKRFAALPNTSVYIEAGSADWMRDKVQTALRILKPAGVKFARGFAFNGTHYDATDHNIVFGAKVAKALARQGIRNKKFVINTAQNGSPFRGYEYPDRNYPDNAPVCTKKRTRLCVTLGIPPTTDVANRSWRLSRVERRLARRYVDAYLWFGRPWLYDQNSPFVMSRAKKLVSSSPFK